MNKSQSHFLISATASNSGKTSITLGLLRAIKNRGKVVQAFKCGPDYQDCKYHEIASDRSAVNLDTFMASQEHVVDLYKKYGVDADVCVTEGMTGLYDGYDRIKGSTDEIAELIKSPVILVIDAKAKGYSIAPIIYGFLNFRKTINIIGVIFNFVSTDTHYQILKKACADVGVLSLGYLPEDSSIVRPDRHLVGDGKTFDAYIDRLADWVDKHIDIDALLKITQLDYIYPDKQPVEHLEQTFTVAVAHDRAFNLFYHENIERFREKSTVSFFSPLEDKELPQADFIYIPSGYPEYYLKELSENKSMIKAIRDYVEAGGYLLAECGAMMYLSKTIIDTDGTVYPMVGVFNQDSVSKGKEAIVGYRKINFGSTTFRGHESHYTNLVNEDTSAITNVVITDPFDQPVSTKLFRYKNAMASYTHIYWDECGLIELFAILLENDYDDI
jgi:cobyrinic acid a,c-diamide synthase